jgi:hypothetical protein
MAFERLPNREEVHETLRQFIRLPLEVLTVYKIDCTSPNTRCSGTRMSLKNKARPERFELPTLWFEDRGQGIL